jgi:hypothetical protein
MKIRKIPKRYADSIIENNDNKKIYFFIDSDFNELVCSFQITKKPDDSNQTVYSNQFHTLVPLPPFTGSPGSVTPALEASVIPTSFLMNGRVTNTEPIPTTSNNQFSFPSAARLDNGISNFLLQLELQRTREEQIIQFLQYQQHLRQRQEQWQFFL